MLHNKEIVRSIPPALWNEIRIWGKDSGIFDITKQNIVSNIAYKLRQNKPLADEEYKKGVEVLDIVATKNEELTGIRKTFRQMGTDEKKSKLQMMKKLNYIGKRSVKVKLNLIRIKIFYQKQKLTYYLI